MPSYAALAHVFDLLPRMRWRLSESAAESAAERWGSIVLTAALIGFLLVSAVLALIDLGTHTLPNRIIFPSLAIMFCLETVAALLLHRWPSLLMALVGALTLGGIYLALSLITAGSLGMGDVKYAVLIGLTVGWGSWTPIIVALVAPFLLGGLGATLLLLLRRIGPKDHIAFGPSMALGGAIAALWEP